MKRYRMPRRTILDWKMLVPLLILLLAATVLFNVIPGVHVPCGCYEEQVRAARRMAGAFTVLYSRAAELGIAEEGAGNDPNRTGLIGPEFTMLTTTVGTLSAKRTSTNPDFSALLVRRLDELGLKRGAKIVLTLSGSFPALNLAAIIACEELALEPLIISSVGASGFGAGHPELTWLDMERLLLRHRIISHCTSVASLGGGNDLGESFFEGGRELALAAIERNDLVPLVSASYQEQLRAKEEAILSFNPAALINVGGNQACTGIAGHLLPPGLLRESPFETADLGLVGWFLNLGRPVIHLLRIRELALRSGLPEDPVPLPLPGKSPVYYETGVNLVWAIALILPTFLYVIWLVYQRIACRRTTKGQSNPT